MHEGNESTIALPGPGTQDVLSDILRRGAQRLRTVLDLKPLAWPRRSGVRS